MSRILQHCRRTEGGIRENKPIVLKGAVAAQQEVCAMGRIIAKARVEAVSLNVGCKTLVKH